MLGMIVEKRKRRRQDEMVGWHHGLNGPEFEQTLGDGEKQGSTGLQRVRQALVTEQRQCLYQLGCE